MELHSLVSNSLEYNPFTGVFVWKYRNDVPRWWNTRYAGTVAGNIDKDGYLTIGFFGKTYKAHRLAWLVTYGFMPEEEIDHKDNVRTNNAIGNLRVASDQNNAANALMRRDNKSGYKGVSWHKRVGKWAAQINLGGKRKSLGYFECKEAAKTVYDEYALKMHGDFARLS